MFLGGFVGLEEAGAKPPADVPLGRRCFGTPRTMRYARCWEPSMNLSNAKVAQLMVPIEDFEKAVAFYRDVLGLPFLFAAPPQMAFFNCGGIRLLVGITPTGEKAQRGSAIYFQVPDIAGVHAFLKSKGVAFKAAPHVVHRTPQSELWLAEFTDPDGNQFALMSEVTPA